MIVVVAFRHSFGLQTMEHLQKTAKITSQFSQFAESLGRIVADTIPTVHISTTI